MLTAWLVDDSSWMLRSDDGCGGCFVERGGVPDAGDQRPTRAAGVHGAVGQDAGAGAAGVPEPQPRRVHQLQHGALRRRRRQAVQDDRHRREHSRRGLLPPRHSLLVWLVISNGDDCCVHKGVASTKKIAKQLGAQQLLALLHERTASTYMQVAELYSGTMKGPAVAISETAASSAAATAAGHTISNSLRSVGTLGRPGDARFGSAGGGSSASASSVDFGSRLRKFRRQADEYPHYDDSYVADHRGGYSQWGTYHQETPQWASGSSVEREDNQGDNPGPERIVVYSSSAPASSGSSYSSYYSGGNAPWTYAPPGGLPPPPAGNLHGGSGAAPSYSGVELENRPRQFGYGGYRSAAGERVAPLDRTKVRAVRAMSRLGCLRGADRCGMLNGAGTGAVPAVSERVTGREGSSGMDRRENSGEAMVAEECGGSGG